ncbi:valine--tRNA ligase [Candidatus Woesearchaeota archaeon]|nr:valine--tRNA ligase [Candidatus Woesearchaeota archaeon]
MDPLVSESGWSREAEERIWRQWVDEEPYAFRNSGKPVFSIDTPPPYINTPIHMGHATTYVLMDMFARFRRMSGFDVLFPLGLDKNGLPIEVAAEKRFGVRLRDVPREKFIGFCKAVLDEAGQVSVRSFQRLGISFNSWKSGNSVGCVYETDSPEYRAFTQDTFIDLWTDGLIYEDERINNYCTGCRTTLADAEVDYVDINSKFNEIIFTVKETGERIVIGTTRPELLCTCAMVIFNPQDERFRRLEGFTAVTPLYGSEVPIRAHGMASMDSGTGLVMMCSMGDTSDIRFFRDMALKPVIAIDMDGRMNENSGFLGGLPVAEARKAVVESLKKEGFLAAQRDVIHRTPVCERSKEPVEFISMKEFYVKQLEFTQDMEKLAYKLNFFAPSSRQILMDWVLSVSIDWPISRRRYYATEIPLWKCNSCSSFVVPPKGRYYQPWREPCPVKKCKCGGNEFVGEERVLDTWFDSSNSPLYISMYGRDPAFFRAAFPCSLRPQGKEIIRTWLYYTLLKCYLLTGKLIFRDAWINYHVVDEQGHKISKSKGNVIAPGEILDRFGTEPLRLWCAVEGNLDKGDFKCSFDRIDGAGKTIVKLWNVARFISAFPRVDDQDFELQELDRWVLEELNSIVSLAGRQYAVYDFHSPVAVAKNFLWETFASHYLELVKSRAYNRDGVFSESEQRAAVFTLHRCLDTLLKLLAPVIPMVTYSLYKSLSGRDIHFEEFPRASGKRRQKFDASELASLNSQVWKAKKDRGLSLKADVKSVVFPTKFAGLAKDLKVTHHVEDLRFGKELKLEF